MKAEARFTAPWLRRYETAERERSETSGEYGCHPCERELEAYISNGVINLDKPAGPTSHEVVAWLKKMLGVGLAGHSGTLEETGKSRGDGRPACLHRKLVEDHRVHALLRQGVRRGRRAAQAGGKGGIVEDAPDVRRRDIPEASPQVVGREKGQEEGRLLHRTARI
ncbi:MAG: hypothetical protein JTT11_01845 [Candidatus Brockarchaeota archaeon]|nr:hypothetical protein [Candidatus Brockarchaeota archaeon]